MDILKTATDWAKAEIFSSLFFIAFGIIFLLTSLGFWQWGKTELAKAYILPTLVAGALLLIIGVGLVYSNKSRLASFPTDFERDSSAFVQSEILRSQKTVAEYQTIVFRVVPIIIAVFALLLVLTDKPLWRAISITTIAMMVVILLVDSNANSRMKAYHQQLVLMAKK